MSPEVLSFFSRFIEKETGIIYAENNIYQLKSRLEDLCKFFKLSSVEELHREFNQLIPNSVMRQKLLDHATNNETLFFRDPSFFTAIESFILREVLLEMPSEIRIWSAASSTGQEALSVAMALEEMSARVPLPPFSIVATDICDKALVKARSGTYTDFEIMRGLSEARKNKFFQKEADGWRAKSSIHGKIKFGYNNLIRSSVTGPFHIILCRNVLIYQNIEMKKIIVETLLRQLAPEGGLLLGVGETLLGVTGAIETINISNAMFYRKSVKYNNGAA
jgi:chemotaxis protein methyltransferase CheR